jgi:hypothetical protein
VALPGDFLEVRNIQVNTSPPQVLSYVTPAFMDTYSGRATAGTPVYYTLVGGEFQIAPYTTSLTIEISYYEQIQGLGSTFTTNWLSTSHPDYYLYGCILEALKFTQDPRVLQIEPMVTDLEYQINRNGRAKAVGAAPLVVRPS